MKRIVFAAVISCIFVSCQHTSHRGNILVLGSQDTGSSAYSIGDNALIYADAVMFRGDTDTFTVQVPYNIARVNTPLYQAVAVITDATQYPVVQNVIER